MITLENNLPEDLDQLYQESLSHIFKSGMTARDAAVRIFSWILHMREPLTPSALLAAISNGQKSTIKLSDLMALCANLVVLDRPCNVMRFAHQSVKDFLERHEAFTGAVAHNILASTCIEVCSRGPISSRSLQNPGDDFYVYAAMYWPIHANMAESMASNKDVVNTLTSFIFDEDFDTTLSFASWLERRGEIVSILANDHDMKVVLDAIPGGDAGPLFLISVFGLTNLLRVVFEHVAGLNLNEKNKHGHTPTYLAAAFGHSASLSMLINHGADVNIQCGKYGSPLHAACFAGQLEVVKTLLKFDANISCGDVFDDAFQAACRGGREGVALFLIDSDLVKSEDDYEKVLEGAARAGFVGVVEKLHEPQFLHFNNSKPDKVKKKMKKAIQGGQLGVIRQFLDQQAERRDVLPLDAVALATLYNHKILVEFLLDEGMSVEAEGAFGTPLRTACLLNYQPIARLLLHRGAEVDACGTFGDALQAAAMKGHTMVVRYIIEEGANVNQQNGFYGTALQAAAYHGQHRAVKLLLDAGANVHAEGYSKDAFHAAAEGGHHDVITLMLRKGYKFYRPLPSPLAYAASPSPYKALMRDASPGRDPGPYRQKQSFRASKIISTKEAKPIAELEAIFGAAEQGSKIAREYPQETPAAGYRPQGHVRKNFPLEAAASAGHEESVKVLLKNREVLGISENEISHAIKLATSNDYWSVVQLLLDDVAKRHSVKPYIKSILEVVRQRQQSPIVGLALAQASEYCSADEMVEIKQGLVAPLHEKPYDPEVNQETLVLEFEKSCKSGDIQVLNAILASEHHKILSPREIDAGLQLCVLNGHTTVVQLLCESPFLKVRLPLSGEEAFVVAAGNGSVDLMRLLTSYWTAELTMSNSVAVIRALVVASGNGHIDVVRYLVQDISADITIPADDKPVGLGLNKSDWDTSSFRMTPNDFKSQSPAREESTVVPVISPLQAALRSFSRFKPSRDPYSQMSLWSKNEPRKAGRSQHEEVIVFLLSHGSKLSDLGDQNVNLIQMAVEFCPTYIAEKFVSAVTDVNATLYSKGALFAAAGRELSSATIVRGLLANGATIPEKVEEQEKLLNQALRYFEGDTRREYFHETTRDPDGRFLEAPSLDYVFNEGSGAVLYDLLRLMPRITATDVQWNLVLQMAALLNNQLFLDLLLSRGADVNAPGYYYGTALEAAARCGHTGVVHKLLDAGAKVNVISGRWQTALRAAIIGCHEAIVETLLKHGADMELRLPRQRLYMNDKEKASNNALQLGVQTGNLSIVKTLLRHGANAAHDEAETLHPLILASKQGNLAMVKVLLDAGAPLNVHGKKPNPHMLIEAENASPMHAAIARGHLDVLELLLSQGADIENEVEHARTPLCVAASKCRADMVHFLLSAGASATDGVALYGAVREKSIEIAKELLAAGSIAEPVLAFACRQGFLPMIELLLEEVYGGENSETVIDELFAIAELDGSVFRLLLDYAQPTMRRFVRICAVCSVALVKIMLDKKGIDVNGQAETDGDYPLQVAALHLRTEVAQLFLVRGADANCKSAEHGTPLMTALEACAAPILRSIKSERANGLVDQLNLPKPRWFYAHNPSNFQQISDCEHIAQLLIDHGANISDNSRPFGSSMQLACLLGSEGLVELLLEKGADLSTTAGYFEKTIFAAIYGGHLGIVELLLQKAPLTRHIHPDFATPLHLACANGHSAIVRKLLEHGADATVLDTKGWTPLTIALEKKRQSGTSLNRSYTEAPPEAPLEVILELANPLRVLNDDMLIALKLGYKDAEKTATLLLDVDKDLIVSEATICHVLKQQYPTVHNQIIQLLVQRNGGIGVTAEMLTAVRTHYNLQELLKHRPIPRITREILLAQKEPRCMKLLVEIDTESPVTEEIIFRALEIGTVTDRRHTSREQLGREVLDILLDHNPDIVVSDEMLQAARCAADMEVLLNHLNPGARLSTDVVAAVSKSKQQEEAYRMMRLLLEYDPSIKLDPNIVLQMMILPDAVDTLDMLLERDPSMPVTEEIFLRVFGPSSSRDTWTRTRLADLMDKYGKRLVFTDRLREVIDRAYQSKDSVGRKKRFYSLRLTEEDDLGLVDEGEDEKTRSA